MIPFSEVLLLFIITIKVFIYITLKTTLILQALHYVDIYVNYQIHLKTALWAMHFSASTVIKLSSGFETCSSVVIASPPHCGREAAQWLWFSSQLGSSGTSGTSRGSSPWFRNTPVTQPHTCSLERKEMFYLTTHSTHFIYSYRKEGNVLFNDTLNTFYLQL